MSELKTTSLYEFHLNKNSKISLSISDEKKYSIAYVILQKKV